MEEVSDEEWEIAGEGNYHISCCDNLSKMVYVQPSRFFLCHECMEEEMYADEFSALRFFYHSPLGIGRGENAREREEQTLMLGKGMLPLFDEAKILRIARKIAPATFDLCK